MTLRCCSGCFCPAAAVVIILGGIAAAAIAASAWEITGAMAESFAGGCDKGFFRGLPGLRFSGAAATSLEAGSLTSAFEARRGALIERDVLDVMALQEVSAAETGVAFLDAVADVLVGPACSAELPAPPEVEGSASRFCFSGGPLSKASTGISPGHRTSRLPSSSSSLSHVSMWVRSRSKRALSVSPSVYLIRKGKALLSG